MANVRPSPSIIAALFGGAALFIMGSRQETPQRAKEPPSLKIYGPVGRTYQRMTDPEEIVLVYREYRDGQYGPVGSSRVWTQHDQVHAIEPVAMIRQMIGDERLALVHICPKLQEECAGEGAEDLVPVFVRPEYIVAISPSKHIDFKKRANLAKLWFSTGASIDIAQTHKQAHAMFPHAEHRETQRS